MTSVKQKLAAIDRERAEIRTAVKKIEGAVAKLKTDIREQERINAAAAREIESGVKKLQGAIKEQASANKSFTREFYFGEGKK